MTEQELQAIETRERHYADPKAPWSAKSVGELARDVPVLLAEVRRLRAELAGWDGLSQDIVRMVTRRNGPQPECERCRHPFQCCCEQFPPDVS